jgi:ATP-binding cassette subfamily B protein
MSPTNLLGELARTLHEAHRTWRFLAARQRLTLAIALGLMAGVGYCTARIPIVLGTLVDRMLPPHVLTLDGARKFLLLLAAIYVAREVMQVARKVVVERTCTSVERDATVRAVSSLLHADLAVLGAERTGVLNGRLHRSVEGLVRLLKLTFLDLFPSAFGAAFAVTAALQKNLALGLLMAGIVPLGIAIILGQLASQRGIRISLLRSKEKVDGAVVEQIGGIEAVRAAHTADREIAKVRAIAEELREKEFRHHLAMSFFDAGKSLNEGAFHIAVVTLAISLAFSGKISSGDIIVFSMLFAAVVAPLREIHRIIDEAHESGIKAGEFFAMLDQPKDCSFEATGSGHACSPRMPMIEARNLTVGYQGADGKVRPILNRVSLSVREGSVTGFAGPSGSGKTTFVRALLRLAHPTGGRLTVGGTPIADLSREAIGSMFGYVGQQPFIFAGTVKENIAYGKPSATAEQIADAARRAQIAEEIDALPLGYEHLVTERGGNLSGGQRQRIALARVFLQNPPILILDEATAALDNENERAVMDAISQAVEGRTVFMVAHRLSSLQHADRIYVFRQGSIVEEGRYDELAALPKGLFAKLLFGVRAAAAVA